jgi:hypothetical protein
LVGRRVRIRWPQPRCPRRFGRRRVTSRPTSSSPPSAQRWLRGKLSRAQLLLDLDAGVEGEPEPVADEPEPGADEPLPDADGALPDAVESEPDAGRPD